jgi:hypothetical protein
VLGLLQLGVKALEEGEGAEPPESSLKTLLLQLLRHFQPGRVWYLPNGPEHL